MSGVSDPAHAQLLALIDAARQRMGDGILADPGRLVPLIADQAPGLRGLARATAAAIAACVQGVVPATPSALAQEAAKAGASPELARDAAALALQVLGGPVETPQPPAPADVPPPLPRTEWVGNTQTGWVGGTSVPTAAPAPAPAPGAAATTDYMALLRRYRWPIAAVAAVAALYLISAADEPGPAPTPTAPMQPGQPTQPGQPGSGQGPALPTLSTTADGALPTIPFQQQGQAVVLAFDVPVTNAAFRGLIVFPRPGWDGAQVAFAKSGSQEPDTISAAAPFELRALQSGPVRVQRPRWTKDGISAGDICVVFRSQSGNDVQLRGSQMCLLEYTANECRKVIGCGRVG